MRMITGKGVFMSPDNDEIYWWMAPGAAHVNVRFKYAVQREDAHGGLSFVKEWGHGVWQVRTRPDMTVLETLYRIYGEFVEA